MMTYEDFKGKVTEEFMSYMPEQYKNMELNVYKANKINRTLDALIIVDSSDGEHISPTIYINDMYNQYMKCADFEAVMSDSVEVMVVAMEEIDNVCAINLVTAKDNIVFQLINTEQNKELLENIPCREFLDLSIIYRLVTKIDEGGTQSAVITNELAEKLGFTEEQLLKLAVENTRRIFPPVVKTLADIMRELLQAEMQPEMLPEIADSMFDELSEETMMWVISNDRGIYGAISMLYEDKLHELALEVDDDLYILPSSMHEVMAVRASMCDDPYEYAEMVSDINMRDLLLEERLSNQVYHYDKDLRKITLATDTPNKRLDRAEADSE